MDTGTTAFYDTYATESTQAEGRHSAMLPTLRATLAPGASVLDVGAGAGRNVAALLVLGFNAFGVEPHAGMRAAASRLHPALAGRLRPALLPDLGQPFADHCPAGFDAVVCSAVLMHIAPAELAAALQSLVSQLRTNPGDATRAPTLLLSLPEMAADRLHGSRDADGRRFHNHAPADVQAHLAALGLQLSTTSASDAVLASTGTRWHTLVFRRD